MAFVEINPRYQDLLDQLGLVAPADFLRLEGVIYGGHPDRHVSRVTLGSRNCVAASFQLAERAQGKLETCPHTQPLVAFLKREHRVRWRDRLVNALAGFGFVSRSYREFALLRQLAKTGIACPEALAVGEDHDGRAFLLLRELTGAVDWRRFLEARRHAPPEARRMIARALGETLARLHLAGFAHRDLFAKHVLVRRDDAKAVSFALLDWQRAQRRRRVSWRRRRDDLAALDATLADDLVSERERLRCLRAYLQVFASGGVDPRRTAGMKWEGEAPAEPWTPKGSAGASPSRNLAEVAQQIRRRAQRLLTKRRVREQRQAPLAAGDQNLIWLDGEAVCVTSDFHGELDEYSPLRRVIAPQLVRRRQFRPFAGLWAWLRGRELVAPEIEQAATLFRLQRYGIVTPRLLAVGQRAVRGTMASFLLTEPVADAVPLSRWLATHHHLPDRLQVVRQAASVVRGMHDAGSVFGPDPTGVEILQVKAESSRRSTVVLGSVETLRQLRQPSRRAVRRNLAALLAKLGAFCRRTEQLRFLLEYFGQRHVTPPLRRLVRDLWRKHRPTRRIAR